MSRSVAHLLGLCLAVVVGLGALGAALLANDACGPFARSPCVRVLFLGNSYTYVNDLPIVLRDLARAGDHALDTVSIAGGGETLADHAASQASVGTIRESRWNFVVLQEQSQIPSVESVRQAQMYPAVRSLVDVIRAAGGTPVLLETWAHRDGWSDYRLDYRAMQMAINAGYRTLGIDLRAGVAPVGEAWQTALLQDPAIALWQDDGSHPSMAGTYLAACVLYASLFRESPVGNSDTAGLSPEVAGALQAIAAVTVGVQ